MKTEKNKTSNAMSTYADLSASHFYLLRDQPTSDILLVSVLALTDKCVLMRSYGELDHDYWKKSNDPIAELIEELDYDSAIAILSVYDLDDEFDEEDDEDESF
ncbi:MAG TPA: hypothetical protein PLQ65_07980 [Flavihumibacter sp.]|nr:hypothetical protein [Bacteroidota bacterium]HQD09587.1 hypothetical protein [Flavihumibacter sp.]